MVFLLFQMGREHYALDFREIVEVLPLLALRNIPQAPAGVAGVFDYRGTPVPAIDLTQLALGRAAEHKLGTRIVLVHYRGDGTPRLLGLIAEKATEILRRDPSEFTSTGVSSAAAPYLGPVCADARGMIQWVAVDRLLPDSIRAVLFTAAALS